MIKTSCIKSKRELVLAHNAGEKIYVDSVPGNPKNPISARVHLYSKHEPYWFASVDCLHGFITKIHN